MYVFTNGLTDTKVGEMWFFNSNLYMLFDNSQVIRAFAPNGIMLNEWALPVSVSEFDKQWEGMYLDQNGDGLYLHLALDSPLEVWSIKLGGVTTPNTKQRHSPMEFPKMRWWVILTESNYFDNDDT